MALESLSAMGCDWRIIARASSAGMKPTMRTPGLAVPAFWAMAPDIAVIAVRNKAKDRTLKKRFIIIPPFECLGFRRIASRYGSKLDRVISCGLPQTQAPRFSANTSPVSSFARENRSQNYHRLPITENYHIDNYWKNFIQFSKHMTLPRAVRCLTIMGRNEKDQLDLAQYLYPSMQAVDIKELDLDIVHAGTDQRKIHMLVREVFPKLKWKVPVAVHHHLIPGLGTNSIQSNSTASNRIDTNSNPKIFSKMSKSEPMKSIFIHDSEEVIMNKMKVAWAPMGVIENNPILEYVKYLIFHEFDSFNVERPSKYGGDVSFSDYVELEREYKNGNIHPLDLKLAVGKKINEIINPIRVYFSNKKELFSLM